MHLAELCIDLLHQNEEHHAEVNKSLARLSIHCFRDAVNYHRDFKIQRRDGNENVALKVNLLSFSLYRNYSCPLTLTYVGEPSRS